MMAAFYAFLKDARLWELNEQAKTRQESAARAVASPAVAVH
jgi:hypothetical protein